MSAPIESPTSEAVLVELREICQKIRDLIRARKPQALIGYFWSQVLMSLIGRHDPQRDGDGLPSVSPNENAILFAMEYVHATIAADGVSSDPVDIDEKDVQEIIALSTRAISLCFQHGVVSSVENGDAVLIKDARLAFQIMSNWVMIRGRRYQVLEQEFFSYVLAPHETEIQAAYGITSARLAGELQKAANAPRIGFDDARLRMIEIMESIGVVASETSQTFEAAIEAAKTADPQLAIEVANIFDDMFNGGLFNLSRHSALPDELLADLAYEPGENTNFFDGSELSGTPFKTLPARAKPVLHLEEGYYCAEPNFIRDASYRSIQRALIKRNPGYQEQWNARQKQMSEDAFPDLMSEHLKGARVFKDVYYPIGKRQWAETDCVVLIDDTLINLEAKAGAEALSPPSENLADHLSRIEDLVEKAYRQSKRFIDYLHEHDDAPLYQKQPDGEFIEIARVSHKNFRKIIPIGLTVEAFSPFSASIKENEDVTPIQGVHSFISLSIDDLMVIRRILRGTGEFLHYLDVRQGLAGMTNVMLFDEMDHLGAYISQNRADQRIQEMIRDEKVDAVWVDGMDQDVIGPYFANPDWPNAEVPSQTYPKKTQELLLALEQTKEIRWLEADTFIRDLSGEGRSQFAEHFDAAFPILRERPVTFFAMGGGAMAMFGLMRSDMVDSCALLVKKAEAFALAFGVKKIRLFQIGVRPNQDIFSARMLWIAAPSLLRMDYGAILEEATRLKAKIKPT